MLARGVTEGCWLQREESEESEELPWAEQGPLPRPSSRWGGLALAPATTQGVCLQLGPGLWALPFPFWPAGLEQGPAVALGAAGTKVLLGRFKIHMKN